MDLSRLRAFLAMPIATLLAVLVLCVLVVRRPQPEVGLRVPLVKLKHHAFGYACEDDIPHVVRLTADGRMWFVKTEVAADKLGPLIAEVNQGRQEHVVYVMADPAVTFGQFASFLGEINSSLPGLHVLLLTGQLRNYLDPPAIGHSGERVEDAPCDLEWSENGFIAPSMNATAPVPLR
jgi:biopolymer transport protein ExbD